MYRAALESEKRALEATAALPCLKSEPGYLLLQGHQESVVSAESIVTAHERRVLLRCWIYWTCMFVVSTWACYEA